jgi:hypothetical protein
MALSDRRHPDFWDHCADAGGAVAAGFSAGVACVVTGASGVGSTGAGNAVG